MLTSFRVRSFKSLADVTVEFTPVTVLIGRSGTGKSNFVEAIRLLRECLTSGINQALQPLGGWAAVRPTVGDGTDLSLDTTFEIPGVREPFEYHLRFSAGSPPSFAAANLVLAEEWLRRGGRPLFHQADGRWLAPPPVEPAPGLSGNPMLGTISGLTDVWAAYLTLTADIGCYDFPGDVMKAGSANGAAGSGLDDHATKFLEVARGLMGSVQSLKTWQRVAAGVTAVNASVRSLTFEAPQRVRLLVGHQIGERLLTIPLERESEGLRRYLAHLLALYQIPPKQLLVFEEPEKGIHPGALESLAEEFRRCPQEGRGQVLLTTHSPDLLDHFRPTELRVVAMRDHVTHVGDVAPEQMESLKEGLLLPGELLTVDPARLPGELDAVAER